MRGARHTNNVTERMIGRSKIRYKTIRDYKSIEGMMNGLWLTQRVMGRVQHGHGQAVGLHSGWVMCANPKCDYPQLILNTPTSLGTVTTPRSNWNMMAFPAKIGASYI